MENIKQTGTIIPSNDVKQVIVVRKDLNMRKGKIAAQASHASLGALLKMFSKELCTSFINDKNLQTYTRYSVQFTQDSILDKWLNGIFTKVVVSVDSEAELDSIYDAIQTYNQTVDEKIPCVMIEDAGLTEFHGIKTKTCIGVGPFKSDIIDTFTKHLKLL